MEMSFFNFFYDLQKVGKIKTCLETTNRKRTRVRIPEATLVVVLGAVNFQWILAACFCRTNSVKFLWRKNTGKLRNSTIFRWLRCSRAIELPPLNPLVLT